MRRARAFLLGDFELNYRVGRGGLGEVWRASRRGGAQLVAIKILTHPKMRDAQRAAMIRGEVQTLASLDHRGIAAVYGFGRLPGWAPELSVDMVEGMPYLVMEYAEGGTLRQAGLSEWAEIKRALRQILKALAYAHAHEVVHRDITPDNILCFDGEEGHTRYKLADFGLAHVRRGGGGRPASKRWALSGTPYYMAPEQVEGRWRLFGPWTDLYQLGCVAYELVCGRRPFEGRYIAKVAKMQLETPAPPLRPKMSVPAGLEEWVHRLMSKPPEERFGRAVDALRGLDALAAGESGAGEGPRVPATWRRSRVDEDRRELPRLLAPAARRLGPTQCVDERDTIWRAMIEVAQSGEPRLLSLDAEARAAAQWTMRRAHELVGCEVLHGQGHEGEEPASGLRAMVERWLQAEGSSFGDLYDLVVRQARRFAEAQGPAESLARGLVGFLRPSAAHSSRWDQLRRWESLDHWIQQVGMERPVFIWLDGVQPGEPAHQFARRFTERCGRGRVLFVVTRKGEMQVPKPPVEGCR